MASESNRMPLGGTGQAPTPAAEAHVEPPAARRERGSRALAVASRLLAGATIFFFLAFVFAYFYLRSLNQQHMWKPRHVSPDQALGAAFIACVLVSVALTLLAGRRQTRDQTNWLAPTIAAVAFGLVAVALQCIEYTRQGFGPTDGAYASIFCAWTGCYLIAVLCTMYWLEIHAATELRERREPSVRPGEGVTVYEDPDKLIPHGMDAAVFYWAFLGAIGVVTYVTLYLL
jgi:heme/copper-type cytochrome/quinol oxidase subunit 3